MAGHSPNFDTILMVEKELLGSDDYPSRTQLWKRLPKRMHYSTFKKVIDYLEASDKIEFNGASIVYIGANDKLKKYLEKFVSLT